MHEFVSILSDALLERFRARAAEHDRNNSFPFADVAELTELGYLAMFAPAALGGRGMGLEQVALEQRRLASAAPATALAINMHQVWLGVAKLLHDQGDHSLDWMLSDAVAGEVFAFGNSEAGNDAVLFDSRTRAEPQPDGSYRYFGRKIFTSLSPAWTRLGIFGRDDTDPENPRLVHGFIDRSTEGYRIEEDWDTFAMRASQSNSTVLDGATVGKDRLSRNLPVGPSNDPFIFGIFANFEILLAAVYSGLADRALELGIAAAKRRTSLSENGRPLSADPNIRWRLADASIALDAIAPQITVLARDVDGGTDHGELWFAKLVGLKVRATETARDVVDKAIRVSGGSAVYSSSELGRLYRDVIAGMFHPSDDESAHATVANALLGKV